MHNDARLLLTMDQFGISSSESSHLRFFLEVDWSWQIFVLTGGGFQGTMNFLKWEQYSTS